MAHQRRAGPPVPVKFMRAVRLHGIGDLRYELVPALHELAPDAIRVRVRAAGICGSDLHNFRTGRWMSRLPTIPGHEFAGEIIALGAAVTNFELGDHVVGDSRVNCGVCAPCRDGRPNICKQMGYVGEVCDGAFAEMIDRPADRLLAVPKRIPLAIAALTEPLGVALRVVRRLGAPRHTPILIAGAGPVGGLCAVLLDHLGCGPLAIIERNPDRARLVAQITGATPIEPTPAAIADFLGRAHPGGLRWAIEATGSDAMLDFLLQTLGGGGRLAMVGIFSGTPAFDANAVVERELTVLGCSVFCEEQREGIDLLPALEHKLARVISPAIALEALAPEYRRLIEGGSAYLKTVVAP